MLNEFYGQFKSGTDIRGVAVEGVKGQHVNLTDDVVGAMADGFVLWLSEKTGKKPENLKISVGRDSRISGPHIMDLCARRFVDAGAEVIRCGLASTPSMFMTTVELGCDGALQITASHHPFNRNGLKFFTRDGGLEGSDIEEILMFAQDNKHPAQTAGGSVTDYDFMSDYSKILRDKIKSAVNAQDYDHPLKGFKIVVDAGNGAGGFYADKVLAPLGADTKGSRFLEPDGMFPNHVPNPEDSEAMASICEAVRESEADLGVIFDTDVDRGGAVDSKGNEINRNRLVALAAAIALEGNDGGTIVTDSITSSGLKEFIEGNLGGRHYRFRRGYKNVIDKALELNAQGVNCPLAIETSGHAAMRENYFLDDGAYLCTKIIIKAAQLRKAGRELDELTASLKEPLESREVRFKITEKDFRACGQRIIESLTAYAEAREDWHVADDNREGIRVSFDKENGDGWFLLRLSVHDPIMPLNIESDSKGGVDIIYAKLCRFLETTKGLQL
ncbi:MAG TPA: phosphomannomutase/phosphoglucomutase [Ruminococcaceae bacterium]|nr:phosphomannomutase/phosphoglucomutase [Oscillospiraceae bacterium]